MKLYKLTDEHDRTYGGCQWGENVCHKTSGEGTLCGLGWTHWYTHPLLAVFLNAILGQFDLATAHLWEGHDGGGKVRSDHGLKVGCTRGTTIRRVELPKVAHEAYVRFAIGCAWQVELNPKWRSWARGWLSGEDRTSSAAHAARVAYPYAYAYASAYATLAAYATYVALARVAALAAYANAASLDLIKLAEWAMTEETEVPDCLRAKEAER